MKLEINIHGVKSSTELQLGGYTLLEGDIKIDNFSEILDLPVGFWSVNDYIEQWGDAASTILKSDNSQSAFITQIFNPEDSPLGYVIEAWPLYRVGDEVFIHNAYLSTRDVSLPIDLEKIYETFPRRETKATENMGPSEWRVTLQDIIAFESKLSAN